ncbi:MAG TPA: carboxypeptidase-like regulatory domain-containing protein [Vicinamibacterales bacterium]|nr:carboxypeptidase-like regulatory domain-containing protein [Vicinamibacterales bacterium]
MTRPIRSVRLVAVAALAALAGHRTSDLRASQTPAATADRIVTGQIVDGATGRGVASALVTITAGPSAVAQPVRGVSAPELTNKVYTDDAGRFMFHSLPAGSFALGATLNRYIAAEYGQTRPSGPAERLELAMSQRVTNVTIKIWRYSEISGTIRDEAGEPLAGARINVILVSGPTARRAYATRDSVVTDDRGAYRSSILTAGNYLIQVASLVSSIPVDTGIAYLDAMSARSRNPVADNIAASGGTLSTAGQQIGDLLIQPSTRVGVTTSVAVDAKGRVSVYPATFYPGVASLAAATVVTVPAGERRTGIDVAVKPVPAFRVSGTVTGSDGPVPHTTVKITPEGTESEIGYGSIGAEVAMAVTRGDGTFTALAVPAGRYVASVTKLAAAPSVDGPAPTDTRLWWARVPITISESDVSRVDLKLASGPTVSGRIELDTDAAAPPDPAMLQRVRILLTTLNPASGDRSSATSAGTDGTFVSRQLRPAKYIVGVGGLPPGWAVKSQQLAGRDVSGEPIEVSESGLRDLVVTVTGKAGELSGTVTRSLSAPEVAVLTVPVDARVAGQLRASLARRVLAGGSGAFRFESLIPGEYIVAAVRAGADDSMEIDVADPRVAAALLRLGSRVTIGDREKRSLNLSVVTVR